jgi:hypothetical protein
LAVGWFRPSPFYVHRHLLPGNVKRRWIQTQRSVGLSNGSGGQGILGPIWDARAIAQDSRGAAGFIWGTLQAHMVMKRFLKHNFNRDPGLNAILIQFILKKKQTDATTMLGGVNIKKLEAQVKRIERDVSNLKQPKA